MPDGAAPAAKTSTDQTHTFTGLTQGAANTLKAAVKCTCIATTYKQSAVLVKEEKPYVPPTPDEKGNPVPGTGQKYEPPVYNWGGATLSGTNNEHTWEGATATWSKDVYTRPGTFTWKSSGNYSAEETITIYVSGNDGHSVAGWATHCGKYISWRDQSNKYGTVSTGEAKAGGIITDTWYNTEAAYVGVAKVSGGPTGTIITANVINKLATAISKGDS